MNTNQTKEEIIKIWEEMNLLERLMSGIWYANEGENGKFPIKKQVELENKYKEIEILFGHESTLSKAIIYYLSQNK